jgi:hypothetical protein
MAMFAAAAMKALSSLTKKRVRAKNTTRRTVGQRKPFNIPQWRSSKIPAGR